MNIKRSISSSPNYSALKVGVPFYVIPSRIEEERVEQRGVLDSLVEELSASDFLPGLIGMINTSVQDLEGSPIPQDCYQLEARYPPFQRDKGKPEFHVQTSRIMREDGHHLIVEFNFTPDQHSKSSIGAYFLFAISPNGKVNYSPVPHMGSDKPKERLRSSLGDNVRKPHLNLNQIPASRTQPAFAG
ncbi:hypothetical protein HYU14_03260 [Candidatus Woesearchaeota archaeon]|nr:hypothetical protein [Candidatus Woesearchaeota archaeon]